MQVTVGKAARTYGAGTCGRWLDRAHLTAVRKGPLQGNAARLGTDAPGRSPERPGGREHSGAPRVETILRQAGPRKRIAIVASGHTGGAPRGSCRGARMRGPPCVAKVRYSGWSNEGYGRVRSTRARAPPRANVKATSSPLCTCRASRTMRPSADATME